MFEIYFPTSPSPIIELWDLVVSFLQDCYRDEGGRKLPDKVVLSRATGLPLDDRGELELRLSLPEARAFLVQNNYTLFAAAFGSERNVGDRLWFEFRPTWGDQAHLIVPHGKIPYSPLRWQKLIEAVISRWDAVIAAEWEIAYMVSQNWTDLESYERRFGESVPSGYRIYREDSYAPFSFHLIDTSRNPGRRSREGSENIPEKPDTKGYGVSAEMWLGPAFWDGAACTKEEVLAADFFLEVRDEPGFLYLKSWPHAFNRPDGEQGRIQQKLWQLLYKEDCEWPPGSGGIADTPPGL